MAPAPRRPLLALCAALAVLPGAAAAGSGSALVIIDMTVEQVANVSYRRSEILETIRRLTKEGNFSAVIDSHLWLPEDLNQLV